LSPGIELFMQSLAYERLIPVEQSPMEKVSLASTVVSGASQLGPHSLGALAAVIAYGDSPIVIVAVPALIILVGAARGIASALEQG
jgi:hypothetical protein